MQRPNCDSQHVSGLNIPRFIHHYLSVFIFLFIISFSGTSHAFIEDGVWSIIQCEEGLDKVSISQGATFAKDTLITFRIGKRNEGCDGMSGLEVYPGVNWQVIWKINDVMQGSPDICDYTTFGTGIYYPSLDVTFQDAGDYTITAEATGSLPQGNPSFTYSYNTHILASKPDPRLTGFEISTNTANVNDIIHVTITGQNVGTAAGSRYSAVNSSVLYSDGPVDLYDSLVAANLIAAWTDPSDRYLYQPNGGEISDTQGNPIGMNPHWLIETAFADEGDLWPAGDPYTMSYDFQPKRPGIVYVRARTTLFDADEGIFYNDPVDTGIIDQNGWSVSQQEVQVLVDPPAIVSVENMQDHILVTLIPSANADYHRLWRSTNGLVYIPLNDWTATPFSGYQDTFETSEAGQDYFYMLQAALQIDGHYTCLNNDYGHGYRLATPYDYYTLDGDDGVHMSWESVEGADYYEVACVDGGHTTIISEPVFDTTYVYDPGDYELHYYTVRAIAGGLTDPLYGEFSESDCSRKLPPTGSLTVTLSPSAISGVAMWKVDDNAWRASGDIVDNLSVGDHTVYFSDIEEWAAPDTQQVSILLGQTTEITGVYIQQLVCVPELQGLSQAQADSLLTLNHLSVGNISHGLSDVIPVGSVMSQEPGAGSSVIWGSPVNIVSSADPIRLNSQGTGDFPNVQAAVNASIDGDTIILEDGVYTGSGNRNIDFIGKAITLKSANGPDNCIIDCQGSSSEPHRGIYIHSNKDDVSVVEGITITGGYAENGGGIFLDEAAVVIKNCFITNNTATSRGGGIYIENGSNEIVGCELLNNTANWGGGIHLRNSGNSRIHNCRFAANTSNYGGGLYGYGHTVLNLDNCLFLANSANHSSGMGGGIWIFSCSPHLTNCDFVDNQANSYPAGYSSNSASCTSTFTNCIFWGNHRYSGVCNESTQYGGSGTYNITYSCIQDNNPFDTYLPAGGAGNHNIDDYPKFIRYPDDGGDGWGDDPATSGVDESANDDFGDMHLNADSPCIDAGDNASVAVDINTDLDGNPRFADSLLIPDTGNGSGPIIDMGVYEKNACQGNADISGDQMVDFTDFCVLVATWLQGCNCYDTCCEQADLNSDEIVDALDLATLAKYWLKNPSALTLFDFESYGSLLPPEFIVHQGYWTIRTETGFDGKVLKSSDNQNLVEIGGINSDNISLEFDFSIIDAGIGDLNICINAASNTYPPLTGYDIGVYPAESDNSDDRILRFDDGSGQTLSIVSNPGIVHGNEKHHVKVVRKNNHIEVSLDYASEPYLEADDDMYHGGIIYIRTWFNVVVDNILIEQLNDQ